MLLPRNLLLATALLGGAALACTPAATSGPTSPGSSTTPNATASGAPASVGATASPAAPTVAAPSASAAPSVATTAGPSLGIPTAAFAVFEPKAGSSTSPQGVATLVGANGQTQVVIGVLTSDSANMAAAIQAGTCENLTPEMAFPLTEVVSGGSSTTVAVDLATLLATPYSINIFVAGSETESSITCGEIQVFPVGL